MILSLPELRRHAVARSLFAPVALGAAIDALGFVQADPIRAPARAQDLILRHRVVGYRAGDLERRYAELDVEEDFFVNYGFLPRRLQALMHPRGGFGAWPSPGARVGARVLAFVRERGPVHPRDVDDHFAHGAVRNYWGGSSSATTHALDHLHYRGALRVHGRDGGIRLYAARDHGPRVTAPAARRARLDALVDVVVGLYAPLPSATLSWLVRRLRHAAPQWQGELTATLARARRRLAHGVVDGMTYYWPVAETPDGAVPDAVRLLAPFDPVVWDRRRFEHLWGWAYRFEAYTPEARRQLGYYALPLLWRDQVIGWANVTRTPRALDVALGFVAGRAPRDRAFRPALEAEIAALRAFLI
ncbi:MAG: crosslink repair DNA glycosylase YcaQ family protein [Vicinamibacterales bacterium]